MMMLQNTKETFPLVTVLLPHFRILQPLHFGDLTHRLYVKRFYHSLTIFNFLGGVCGWVGGGGGGGSYCFSSYSFCLIIVMYCVHDLCGGGGGGDSMFL